MVAHDYRRVIEAGAAQLCESCSATPLHRETVMTSEDHDADLHRTRSPIGAAAVLLGIYIAMYLTVWLTIRALTSPEAAAAIPPASSAVFAAPVTVSISTARAAESPSRDSIGQATEPADDSRECSPDVGIDYQCIFN